MKQHSVAVDGTVPKGHMKAVFVGGPLDKWGQTNYWAVSDPPPDFVEAEWPDGRVARYVLQSNAGFVLHQGAKGTPQYQQSHVANYVDPMDWAAGTRVREQAVDDEECRIRIYQSIGEARLDPHGALIYASEYGGVVTLTAPLGVVNAGMLELIRLGSDLDAVQMMYGDWTIATMTFESHPAGARVPYWGRIGDDVLPGEYLHLDPEVVKQATQVIHGDLERIDTTLLNEVRNRQLSRLKKRRDADGFYASRGLPWDCDISPPMVRFNGS